CWRAFRISGRFINTNETPPLSICQAFFSKPADLKVGEGKPIKALPLGRLQTHYSSKKPDISKCTKGNGGHTRDSETPSSCSFRLTFYRGLHMPRLGEMFGETGPLGL